MVAEHQIYRHRPEQIRVDARLFQVDVFAAISKRQAAGVGLLRRGSLILMVSVAIISPN